MSAISALAQDTEIWFLDRALYWHFLTDTFTAYYRLLITHLGLPQWQYAFTSYGISPQAKVREKHLSSNCGMYQNLLRKCSCYRFPASLFRKIWGGTPVPPLLSKTGYSNIGRQLHLSTDLLKWFPNLARSYSYLYFIGGFSLIVGFG